MTVFKHEHPTRGKTGMPANHPARRFDGVILNVAKGAKPEAPDFKHELPLSAESCHCLTAGGPKDALGAGRNIAIEAPRPLVVCAQVPHPSNCLVFVMV